jgi:hypothetical protein
LSGSTEKNATSPLHRTRTKAKRGFDFIREKEALKRRFAKTLLILDSQKTLPIECYN